LSSIKVERAQKRIGLLTWPLGHGDKEVFDSDVGMLQSSRFFLGLIQQLLQLLAPLADFSVVLHYLLPISHLE
jgi:hypothetical protein